MGVLLLKICQRALSDIMLVELEKVNITVSLETDIIFDLQFWKIEE